MDTTEHLTDEQITERIMELTTSGDLVWHARALPGAMGRYYASWGDSTLIAFGLADTPWISISTPYGDVGPRITRAQYEEIASCAVMHGSDLARGYVTRQLADLDTDA